MSSEKRAMPAPKDLLVRAAERGPEETMRHPLNPLSEIHGHTLSRKVGLARIGVNLIRIPPGKESFEPHLHHSDEEFMYVLSGRGTALVGEEALEIGPGDFLGFPPATLAHHVRNGGTEDLVYLSGGENGDIEVADFPRLGKRLVRIRAEGTVYPLAAGEPIWGRR
jgi:uncharacterized cupin superfamily protein